MGMMPFAAHYSLTTAFLLFRRDTLFTEQKREFYPARAADVKNIVTPNKSSASLNRGNIPNPRAETLGLIKKLTPRGKKNKLPNP